MITPRFQLTIKIDGENILCEVCLDNSMHTIKKGDSAISIVGLQDVGFYAYQYDSEEGYRSQLKKQSEKFAS